MYARRGQCFTTTKYITVLEKDKHIVDIDDIKRERLDNLDKPEFDENGVLKKQYYTFTDGCGNISRALCDEINKKFGLSKCSAYQVRLGGAKGVLMMKYYNQPEQ